MNGLFSIDALARKAMQAHREGRLAEAEAGYRQVMGLQPGNVEIMINCAIALSGQGKAGEAGELLRRIIALRPNFAMAHHKLGDALCQKGDFPEAVNSYRRAIRLDPNHGESFNNLANALLQMGDAQGAVTAYRRTTQMNPGFAPAHNNLGLAYMALGEWSHAKTSFEEAIKLAPPYAEAHNNLGYLLLKKGKGAQARQCFQKAIDLNPRLAGAHSNLAISLMSGGKTAEALAAAQYAVQLDPGDFRAHDTLGKALWAQGDLRQAEDCLRLAIALNPDYPDSHHFLALVLQEDGRLDEAFAHYRRYAELAGAGPRRRSDHKLRHDAEQRDWLAQRPGAAAAVQGAKLPEPAVNPGNDIKGISENWQTAAPQIVVIDNLLTPPALEALRDFCLSADVWRKSYDDGYLGAMPEQGFAAPLMAQIAGELRKVYPAIVGDYPLLYFWGFKYDSSLKGINVHADFAAVNVNFWITPDDANLDPGRGGLVVWDVAAPLDWNFARYNASHDEIRKFLERNNARAVRIPYRANRAVIFDSDLFHETDDIHFKPGYENRRINVTLLFGRRKNSRDTGAMIAEMLGGDTGHDGLDG
jgi:tetratricopeptide (TPR) repeat protein